MALFRAKNGAIVKNCKYIYNAEEVLHHFGYKTFVIFEIYDGLELFVQR